MAIINQMVSYFVHKLNGMLLIIVFYISICISVISITFFAAYIEYTRYSFDNFLKIH